MCDYSREKAISPGSSTPGHDQKNEALRTLAFWSHPAWLQSAGPSMTTVAVKEWVAYHRISVAVTRVTAVEVVGSVRGVIPQSRLSTYGDYRYDIDCEDMCRVSENEVRHPPTPEISAICPEEHRGHTCNTEVHRKTELKSLLEHRSKKRSLRDWLGKLNDALERVRQIGHEEALLQDSRTDAILKTCLLFLRAAAVNETLVEWMRSEVYFIVDYQEVWKEPVSRMELLSIPQPPGAEVLDAGQVDALWTQLSSPQIRKLWQKDDAKETFPPRGHLAVTNFLRSHRQKGSESSEWTQPIPEQAELDLLGSLLHVINETPDSPCTDPADSSSTLSSLFGKVDESKPRSGLLFRDVRGEWIQLLSAHGPHQKPVRQPRRRPQRRTSSDTTMDESLPVKPQVPPLYKSLPPAPSLSLSTHTVRPMRMYCPRRWRMPAVASNTAKTLQLQLKTPLPSISAPLNWNCSLPVRLTTPVQAVDTARVMLVPMRMTYPIKSYRLQTPVIQQNLAVRSQHPLPQPLGLKPRFLGAITMEDIKRAQERHFHQNCKSNEGGVPVSVPPDSISSKDKVGRWLQSVNQYANSGSFVDIHRLLCEPGEILYCPYARRRAEDSLRVTRINCAYEDLKEAFRTFARGKPRASAHRKLSKCRLAELLTKHSLVLKRVPFKCKKGKDLESQLKLTKTYFLEMSFASNNDRYQLKRAAKMFLRNHSGAKRTSQSNKDSIRTASRAPLRLASSPKIRFHVQEDFRTLVRETHEFNALPSKRRRLGSTLFHGREAWTRQARETANLVHCDSVIDELLFSEDGIEELSEENSATVNGWSHFKMVVKTLMNNIVSALRTAEKPNY